MKTCLITTKTYQNHDNGPGHPENVNRVTSINTAIDNIKNTEWVETKNFSTKLIELAHDKKYIEKVNNSFPNNGLAFLDSDTIVSQGSKRASYDAVNSVLTAIDNVQDGSYQNAFVSIRPPGHHAHSNFAAGFCIFNNIAIGACYLVKNYNLKRVLILDWDVHRGDGTAEIISNKKNIFLISSHQYPFYPPGDGTEKVRGHFDNIRFFPLKAGLSSNNFHKIYEKIFIEIDKYQPEFILISCGFDAHKNDPLAEINLESVDYEYLTLKVKKYAAKHCAGKIVSVLEGGYDLKSISESSKFHVKSLAKI